jgi:hypothetical protein
MGRTPPAVLRRDGTSFRLSNLDLGFESFFIDVLGLIGQIKNIGENIKRKGAPIDIEKEC